MNTAIVLEARGGIEPPNKGFADRGAVPGAPYIYGSCGIIGRKRSNIEPIASFRGTEFAHWICSFERRSSFSLS
jgi:hypothetical protein